MLHIIDVTPIEIQICCSALKILRPLADDEFMLSFFGPILLTKINVKPSMCEYLHVW